MASGSSSSSNPFLPWSIPRRVLYGTEEVICHQNTNQYAGASGISACGLAALNFARIAFREARSLCVDKEDQTDALIEHARDEVFLSELISRKIVEEITSICSEWDSDTHLDVENIYGIPIFDRALRLVRTNYGSPGLDEFEGLIRELLNTTSNCVAIITRPPEIIACMKITLRSGDIFAIFDSHSRPDYPDGSGLILSSSIRGTAARLSNILHVDNHLLRQANMQWQTQMLANFSAHIFVPRDSDSSSEALTQSLIASSLKILELEAEIANLRSRNTSFALKQRQIDAEAEAKSITARKREWSWPSLPLSILGAHKRNYSETSTDSWPTVSANVSSTTVPSSSGQHLPSPESSTYQHNRRSPYTVSLSQGYSSATAIQFTDIISPGYPFGQQVQSHEGVLNPKIQNAEPPRPPIKLFKCGVCFDEQAEDFITRVDICGHQFCRDCIQGHVKSKLEERRFPITCPSCMTSQSSEPAVISNELAQQIGLTEAQFMIWTELEMVPFSILLFCQRCKQSGYVDKEDYEESNTLSCPFSNCQHMWCKACQQPIVIGDPEHSCDGSTEFNLLMERQGWKFCPSCKTPFMKTSGCNHMTCTSPGCNTHFCYICGDLIIRSSVPNDISTATEDHFRRCNMFETVDDPYDSD